MIPGLQMNISTAVDEDLLRGIRGDGEVGGGARSRCIQIGKRNGGCQRSGRRVVVGTKDNDFVPFHKDSFGCSGKLQ